MKILITGHRGFLGKKLWETLETKHELYGFDLGDKMPKNGVDLVVHLAASANAYASVEDPTRAKGNIDVLFDVLEWMRKTETPKIVYASSREIYSMENPYGVSKYCGELIISNYAKLYKIGAVSLRIANVYGEDNLQYRFIQTTIAKANKNEDIEIYGGNDKIMNFIYKDDCINRIIQSFDHAKLGYNKAFDLVGSESYKLVDLAVKIIQKLGSKSKVVLLPGREGETMQYIPNNPKHVEVSIDEGIDRCIQAQQ